MTQTQFPYRFLPCLSPGDVQHHICKGINKEKNRVSSPCPSDPHLALLIVLSTHKQN